MILRLTIEIWTVTVIKPPATNPELGTVNYHYLLYWIFVHYDKGYRFSFICLSLAILEYPPTISVYSVVPLPTH